MTIKQFFKQWIKALRVHQWSKNLLLFFPLFMSHSYFDVNLVCKNLIAFVAFSLIASAVYILNDLSDLESDRKHPTKKHRPFASGKLSIVSGAIALSILLSISFLLAIMFLPNVFIIVLIVYVLVTTAYSLFLKKIIIIDVLILGALYALRVLAGGLALNIHVSLWLLCFTFFFFLSLAFVKRLTDLIQLGNSNQNKLHGRSYSTNSIKLVQTAGIGSGIVSIIVLMMYMNSEQVKELYSVPALIWVVIPIILFWLIRVWIITKNGKMNSDPIIFAFSDKVSYVSFLTVLMVLVIAANY